MTVTVRHPHLPGVSRTIPEADLDRWVAQGWLPPVPETDPAPAPTTKPERKRRRNTRSETAR